MIDIFVPGRLCLFGEHSDWAGGYRAACPAILPGMCITAGTDQGIYSAAQPCPGRFRAEISCPGPDVEPIDVPFETSSLAAVARGGGFWSYAAGTALAVRESLPVDGLAFACLRMDLPMRKGLSSSAAICVTVARAFNRVYGLGLTTRDEMELAYRGETLTPSQCGRMDQVCALGHVVSLLTFGGDGFEVAPLTLGGQFSLLVVDVGGTKDTVRILRDLNACFPDRADAVACGVRQALGTSNHRLCAAALGALRRGDAASLGALMDEAQHVFDRLVAPACPGELAAPLLHRVLSHPPLRRFIHGGKGVGSQGDGCAQLVCRGPAAREEARAVIEEELGMSCLDLTLAP